jgi:hypothetical protein
LLWWGTVEWSLLIAWLWRVLIALWWRSLIVLLRRVLLLLLLFLTRRVIGEFLEFGFALVEQAVESVLKRHLKKMMLKLKNAEFLSCCGGDVPTSVHGTYGI